MKHAIPVNPDAMLLLTDGTVMVQDYNDLHNWWRLTPNAKGSYTDGTWTQLASLPPNYAPLYFASAVLPDGRVIIEGGEYNLGSNVWTTLGAIYDPMTNKWTMVAPPTGADWSTIGDASSVVLPNGKLMLGSLNYADALLNPKTLTWKATGTGKADHNDEEGWALLPNGKVLTHDSDNPSSEQNTEVYDPATGAWTSAGVTPVPLDDANGELGPELVMPNGDVFAAGGTGNNAIYSTATGTWRAGPSFPVINGEQFVVADGPGAVLPDGKVLLEASAPSSGAHFFVSDGQTLDQVPDAPDASILQSYEGRMLVLPTGAVLFTGRGQMAAFTDGGAPKARWRPVVSAVPAALNAGTTYTVSGKQLNGLSQGAAYGDDSQDATNYPLVRITNTATGDVFFARTFGMTSMSDAPNRASSAQFTLPAVIENGPSTLAVVANGIASASVNVTVAGG